MDRFSNRRRRLVCGGAVLLLLSAACSSLGPPPMEPLSEGGLEAAERRWEAHGADSYHVVVRVRASLANPAVYDVVVEGRKVASIERDGEALPPGDPGDYSVSGLFHLLRENLPLAEGRRAENTLPIDLRVRFEKETGRLVQYRRTVGTSPRRYLFVEVLEYEPLAGRELHGSARDD